MELLLNSLESCPSISQLSLVCPSLFTNFFMEWSEKEFSCRLVRLCDKLSQLVALFCYFRVPFKNCKEANQLLKKRFQTERPAFCVDVQSMLNQNGEYADRREFEEAYIINSKYSNEFPVMFNDLLTSCQSQVALYPYSCNTFLQR